MHKPLSSAKRESAIMRGIQYEEKNKKACPRTRASVCECASVNQLTESKEATTAVCVLEHSDTVEGTILLKQEANGPTLIVGKITGLTPGEHGFHIHEYGDLSQGCESAGDHYNPDGVDHGDLEKGHVGDLGNVTANKDGVATIKIVAKRVDLTGERSVVGRAIVVHEDKDDLGKGGDAESLKTGNAGDRLACGVITLKETVNEAWSKKYKDSINCSNPKGFSQKAHCASKKKKKKTVEDSGSDLDRLYNIIDELTPDDVGEQRSGEYVLKFEGFSAWCQNDAAERCELPDGDPRKLNAYEDVYDEVQGGWDKEMGSEPIDAGFSGDEDYPVQWAIYKTNINENLRDRFGKVKGKKK